MFLVLETPETGSPLSLKLGRMRRGKSVRVGGHRDSYDIFERTTSAASPLVSGIIGRDRRRVKDLVRGNFQLDESFKRMARECRCNWGLFSRYRLRRAVVLGGMKISVESRCNSAILARMSLGSSRPRVRARVSTQVFLRLTAMDVCCGPPVHS